MLRFSVHYGIHFLLPVAVAFLLFRKQPWRAVVWMWAGMLIDLDHLLADPVFDPSRCSLGFHPLHSYWMVPAYAALALWPKTRVLGLGLLIHIMADGADCLLQG
ncbi:DUF6122 family protein [Robiginitalea sediminis]|uniref:DUF6122 family protein n=1 Tax=Robiginitalea sediminis TaxID=1982593 RepID=UPI000B4ABE8F|nr:DUF6122 family protein [Robiginitalea sediminis]